MDYTIKKGDNLSTIAQNNNTDVATLTKLNNIQNPDLIQEGQIIKLGNNTQVNPPTENLSNNITGNITPKPISIQDIQKPAVPVEVPINSVQTYTPTTTNLAQDILNKTAVAETDAQKTARELSTKISALLPSTVGESQALSDAQKQFKVDELNKNLNDINSQILLKQAELSKDDASLAMGLQNIEDKPIAMEFITGQQSSIQRQAQIAKMAKSAEINMLNARSLALQGNIELANKMAQEAVNLKYAPIKETINLYSAQLKALEPLLTADEKKVAREQEIKTKLAMNEVEQKQANEKQIQDLIINASSQGANAGLVEKASKATTPMQAASILGIYAGDARKAMLLDEQIKTERAQRAKIISETISTNGTNSRVSAVDTAKSVLDNIKNAEALSDVAGRSATREFLASIGGVTKLDRLKNQVTTIKSNLLTLATDPNIKKFFGPQMSENDVKQMLATASTLDAENMTPTDMQNELKRVSGIFQKFAPKDYKPTGTIEEAKTGLNSYLDKVDSAYNSQPTGALSSFASLFSRKQ